MNSGLIKENELADGGNNLMEVDNRSISLSYPSQNQTITILKPAVLKYILAMKEQAKGIENDYVFNNLNGDHVKIADYYRAASVDEKSKRIPLIFDAKGFASNQTFTVSISTNPDVSNAKQYGTTDSFVTVDNLYANTTYYWQVSSGDIKSEINSFTTDGYTRMISADYVANIRDMGGHPVAGGKHIKQGLIFRGGELVYTQYKDGSSTHSKTLSDRAIEILVDDLGIGMEVDFRGASEANNATESDLGDDIEYRRYSIGGYGGVITSSSHYAELKELFTAFANAESKHVYFHCWGGADRTGTIGFLLGGLLGMSYTDLVIDYELTSFSKNLCPHDSKGEYWDFPGLISALKNANYWEEGKSISDTIKTWMMDKLQMTEQEVEAIKTNLLED